MFDFDKFFRSKPAPIWIRKWLGPNATRPKLSIKRDKDKDGNKTWKIKFSITW